MPENHVFVDYDNVSIPPFTPDLVKRKRLSLSILVGPGKKLDSVLAEELLNLPSAVHLVRLAETGRNAVDFALAYYAGRTSVAYPDAYIHIVSKDKGFDPLVKHLQSRSVKAMRHDSIAEFEAHFGPVATRTSSTVSSGTTKETELIPSKTAAKPFLPAKKASKKAAKKSKATDLYAKTLEHLKPLTGRPKTEGKLRADLKTYHGKKISDAVVEGLVTRLKKSNIIKIAENGRIIYDPAKLG